MPATAQRIDDFDSDETVAVDPADALQEDVYWERRFSAERYYTPGLDYEDYAPAYCVGYIGYAQYGGSYDEAEKSLHANWERIKGGSRLSLDAARQAMRAAWDRMAGRPAELDASVSAKALRLPVPVPLLFQLLRPLNTMHDVEALANQLDSARARGCF